MVCRFMALITTTPTIIREFGGAVRRLAWIEVMNLLERAVSIQPVRPVRQRVTDLFPTPDLSAMV